ncbi:hypothetical protein [Halegenticoccus tardaugens]|nr:hypothetical protein [Halegenticoccus tardaugens]
MTPSFRVEFRESRGHRHVRAADGDVAPVAEPTRRRDGGATIGDGAAV